MEDKLSKVNSSEEQYYEVDPKLIEKTKRYVSKHLYINSLYISSACDGLTKDWDEHNVKNTFQVKTEVIYLNRRIGGGQFRVKVLIESYTGEDESNNIIFYWKQSAISDKIIGHTKELKLIIQDFVRSAISDLIKEGLEKSREKAIEERRYRIFDVENKDVTNAERILYPLKKDESYEIV